MNHIKIDLERTLSDIDRNIFGGYLESGIYGGIYYPDSPLADKDGLRSDIRAALKRLNFSNIRYPGGNFASQYHWMDGVGPRQERPGRLNLALYGQSRLNLTRPLIVSNHFGTNEYIQFCRKVNAEPCLCVNCGDGDMREAADWVEYCNGTGDTALANLRREHGFEEPHKVKYWGIGNEPDGRWQVGYKTPQEYARAVAEFGKVMKRVDPDIKIIAAGVCLWQDNPGVLDRRYWECEWVERVQLLLEEAGDLIDYISFHRYYHPKPDVPFETIITLSELYDEHLSAYEGLIHAVCLNRGIKRRIDIAVDEFGIIYVPRRKDGQQRLVDTLITAMHLNSFIRHAYSVRLANFTSTVRSMGVSPTRPDSLVLQPNFYPFELYSRTCGQQALDVFWSGEIFDDGECTGIRVLDVAATLDESRKQLVVYVVNRSQTETMKTVISLPAGQFAGDVQVSVVNGPDMEAGNTFEKPNQIGVRETALEASGTSFNYSFEPHSVTALVCAVS